MTYPQDDDGPIHLSPEEEADERQDTNFAMKIGVYAVPIILIHLYVIYIFVSAATGFTLDSLPFANLFFPFLWVNGGLIGGGIYYWRKGGFPVSRHIRLTGWKGRYWIIAVLFTEFALFIAPRMLRTIWDLLIG